MSAKFPYREGTWFAVPLLEGGFGAGVVARMSNNGILLGYFFGPQRSDLATVVEATCNSPKDAVLVRRFGDRGLIEHRWPILLGGTGWSRSIWTMPVFGHHDATDSERWWKRIYADDNPRMFVRQEPISAEECALLPQDGFLGHLALEKLLTHILSN